MIQIIIDIYIYMYIYIINNNKINDLNQTINVKF